MIGYVIKSKNGEYVGNRGVRVDNILDALYCKKSETAKMYQSELNEYKPEEDWKIISVAVDEVAVVI